MGKLHEILAVENGLAVTAKKLATESIKTFGKDNLFSGHTTILEMFDDSQSHLNTTETTIIDTTVDENLEYLNSALTEYWDVVLQKESANQEAKANLVVDDVTIAENLPATYLLGLETKIAELRKVYEAIPTLPPGKDWQRDTTERIGIFRDVHDEIRFKTEKDVEFKIAAEATKEHPAQVVQLTKNNNVGKYTTRKKSGMITPLEKAMRLKRLDMLLRSVKKARQRANNVEVKKQFIGEALLNYINYG